MSPTDVQAIGNEIAIKWSDDSEDYFKMDQLRLYSPSAANMGEKDLLGHTIGGSDRTDYTGVTVNGWDFVGGYAILFRFSDGHQTGIFSYQYLKDLAHFLQEQ